MDEPQNQEKSRWAKFVKIGLIAYLLIFFLFMVGGVAVIIFGLRYFNQRLNTLSNQVNNVPNAQNQNPIVDVKLKSDAPALGNADAKVTLVEFADFQCPFCKEFQDTIFPDLKTRYIDSGKIKFVFQDFSFLGDESTQAAEAAKCAQDQNKFWPYHDKLYVEQKSENSGAFSATHLKSFASQLGLDASSFNQCLDSSKYKTAVADETTTGTNYGVSATPTIFINGQKYEGVGSVADYEQVIDAALAEVSK